MKYQRVTCKLNSQKFLKTGWPPWAYDFFGSQYVQRYTSQLTMYVLYTEIGHSVRLRV